MQRRRSCQNSCSIHVYVVPTAVCTPVLYTLIVTVQLSFLPDRLEHRIHPGDTTQTDTTQSQMLSSGSPTKNEACFTRTIVEIRLNLPWQYEPASALRHSLNTFICTKRWIQVSGFFLWMGSEWGLTSAICMFHKYFTEIFFLFEALKKVRTEIKWLNRKH